MTELDLNSPAVSQSATDFDMGRHEAYDDLVNRVRSVFTDPTQALKYSTPAQIAEVVYEAATDGKNQLRYRAGEDAKESYALRK
jgi:hypothetical protein